MSWARVHLVIHRACRARILFHRIRTGRALCGPACDGGCVSRIDKAPPGLAALLRDQEGVISTASALGWMSRQELRWCVTSGRWQRPCHGILLAHSGPMTPGQRLWAALLWAGQGAALAGLTAAGLDGLEGFAGRDGTDHPIHLLVPCVVR